MSAVKRRASSGASGAAPDFTQRRPMLARKLALLGRLTVRQQRRRHAQRHRDAFLGNHAQRALAIEARHQHQRAAAHQRQVQPDRQPVDVIQRQEAQHHIASEKAPHSPASASDRRSPPGCGATASRPWAVQWCRWRREASPASGVSRAREREGEAPRSSQQGIEGQAIRWGRARAPCTPAAMAADRSGRCRSAACRR